MHILSRQLSFIAFLGSVISLPQSSIAETVYKSVDDKGNVSYSSKPIEQQTAEKIKLLPTPSADDVDAAKQRLEKNLETGKTLEESRQKREQKVAEQQRLKRERQEQMQANKPVEEPKQQGPYYGIPGHGIIVLPKGPTINR